MYLNNNYLLAQAEPLPENQTIHPPGHKTYFLISIILPHLVNY